MPIHQLDEDQESDHLLLEEYEHSLSGKAEDHLVGGTIVRKTLLSQGSRHAPSDLLHRDH